MRQVPCGNPPPPTHVRARAAASLRLRQISCISRTHACSARPATWSTCCLHPHRCGSKKRKNNKKYLSKALWLCHGRASSQKLYIYYTYYKKSLCRGLLRLFSFEPMGGTDIVCAPGSTITRYLFSREHKQAVCVLPRAHVSTTCAPGRTNTRYLCSRVHACLESPLFNREGRERRVGRERRERRARSTHTNHVILVKNPLHSFMYYYKKYRRTDF